MVLVILGVMAAVAGVAFGTRAPVPIADARAADIARARDVAIRSGHPTTITLTVAGQRRVATAFPDGRVATDAPVPVDPLSGRALHASR